MTTILPLVVLASIALTCLGFRHRGAATAGEAELLDRLTRSLEARHTPLVLGIINAFVLWWWMGWYPDPAPVIQDEAAYLLQAAIFARGNWTEAARPLPEFFAQMHVFTAPALASKYPPGTSLFLAPFVAIGFTALAPMLLAAVSSALVFVLSRRITNAHVALLTWLFWSTGSALLRYQGSFLSQTVTSPLWLAALYLLLEYRTRRGTWHIVALGASLGMIAITRPVTAVALALPVAVVVLRDAWRMRTEQRSRAWQPIALAALAGCAIVSILPLHNYKTTGDWRRSPLVAYATTYAPFDLPGFGYDSTRRFEALPADLHDTRAYLTEARRRHTVSALPATLATRARFALSDIFLGWRVALALFALLGIVVMPVPGAFALITSAILLLAYAFHAHWADWTVYYFEGYPAIVFASAVGLWSFAEWVVGRRPVARSLQPRPVADPSVRAAIAALCAIVIISAASTLPKYRSAWQHNISYQRRLITALSIIEQVSPRSIVFIDYGRVHRSDLSLVWNVPDLATARAWLAYDRGLDNIRLMRLAPDRRAFVFTADEGRITPLPPLAQFEKIVSSERTIGPSRTQ